jgi:hypothetical protein
MLKHALLIWLFKMKLLTCNCHYEIKHSGLQQGRGTWTPTKIGILPKEVNESSGLIPATDSTYWTLNDGGGTNELFEITKTGKLIRTQAIPTAKNNDWEELTKDAVGHIFIGDFGNNNNSRKDLMIYKVNPNKGSSFTPERIKIHYANQESFPAIKESKIFDCEAMFAKGDSLYLFSKNRGGNHLVQLYTLKSEAGEYALLPKDEISLKAQVTGAAISPDGSEFVLLSYGKLYFFDSSSADINFKKPKFCVKMPLKQAESITFESNSRILITNEQGEIWQLSKN